ncbi:MAG: flippase-like domain-containing protein [Nitrospinae bacterium]|nr:flippase-like domain-containing protein [Nitrospinota bacterium]
MNKTKAVVVLFGLGFVAYLFNEIGSAAVFERLSSMGWKSVLVFLPFLLCNYIDTWAWIFTFPPPFSRYSLSFASVFWLRLCGEAVNNFTATAHVGGDVTRVYCLRNMGVPMTQGTVSVVMDKAALIISEILFIYTGVFMLLAKIDWPAWLKWTVASSLILALAAIYGVLALVHRGVFSKIVETVYHRWKWERVLKFYEKVKHLDAHLAQFYRDHGREFVRSNVWHYIGWLAGALETWTLLYLLGIEADLFDALMIESLMTLVKGLGFFIVGSLGIQEGGSVFLFHLLDMGHGAGLAFSLLKRAREIFYGLAGWIAFSVLFSGAGVRESQAPLS